VSQIHALRKIVENIPVIDNRNGTYTASYQIQKPGKYKLSVQCKCLTTASPSISEPQLIHVCCSPFDLHVISSGTNAKIIDTKFHWILIC
jgi:hypothetical protein